MQKFADAQQCADEWVGIINGHVKEEATKDIQEAIELCNRLDERRAGGEVAGDDLRSPHQGEGMQWT